MFTGIIETLGKVISLKRDGENLIIVVASAISSALKVDQSVSHNGACLTVIAVDTKAGTHTVTAISETLAKTNLGSLKPGSSINLERSVKIGDRLDGHIVQGHVDTTATCKKIENQNGSHIFTFEYSVNEKQVTVEKGSVCINGVSLTVVDSGENKFSVAIIPYTLTHTTFNTLQQGDVVNIEFDILGKYVAKIIAGNKVN